jgi:hypothetical protein
MNIGTDIQEILIFCLSNLIGFNVGNTDGKFLLITPLRWGSCVMIYILSFIKISSGIQKLRGDKHSFPYAHKEES